ncbi:hypothetical protein LY76DRAFT_608353 [Colletotrichum caudatum]|nr:hypothetical protein LY76DRAFT_608353 [Colletotrichum caudatum]
MGKTNHVREMLMEDSRRTSIYISKAVPSSKSGLQYSPPLDRRLTMPNYESPAGRHRRSAFSGSYNERVMRANAWNEANYSEKRPDRKCRPESDSSDAERYEYEGTRVTGMRPCPNHGVVLAFRADCGMCRAKSEQVFELPVAAASTRLMCTSDCVATSRPRSTAARNFLYIAGALPVLIVVGLVMMLAIGMDSSRREWPSLDGGLFLGW